MAFRGKRLSPEEIKLNLLGSKGSLYVTCPQSNFIGCRKSNIAMGAAVRSDYPLSCAFVTRTRYSGGCSKISRI